MVDYKWVPGMEVDDDETVPVCQNCGHLTPELGCNVSYKGDYILRPELQHPCYFSPSRWMKIGGN